MTMEKATHTDPRGVGQTGFLDRPERKLHREYRSCVCVQAYGFMTQVALLAERAAHHPEWFNVHNRVVVDLTTHEAQGITQKDLDLAREMEQVAGRM